MKNIVCYVGILVFCFLLLTPGSANAQQRDVDFDFTSGIVDQLLSAFAPAMNFPLAERDNDGNGMWEDHTLGMLGSILRGGTRTDALNAAFPTMGQVRTDFQYNRNAADFDMNATGTSSGQNCWLLSNAGMPCRLTHIITSQVGFEPGTLVNCLLMDHFGGLATAGDDPDTFTFVNNYLDEVLSAFASTMDSSFWQYIDDVRPDIHVDPSWYKNWGNNPAAGCENRFGPAGDLDNDGTTNQTEYNTAGDKSQHRAR